MATKTLKILILCGAVYFLLVALAHAGDYRIPGLFLYFHVPSFAYQDKIIALLSFGWATFFFVAASTMVRKLVQAVLISGALALVMLTFINVTTDFKALGTDIRPLWFHLETGLLGIYWLALLFSYLRASRDT